MVLKKAGIIALLVVVLVAVVIAVLFLPEAIPDLFEEGGVPHVLTRFLALYGFLFLSVATLTTPFLAEVTRAFGKPFLQIHHVFSALGIALITLHPVFNAIEALTLEVFVPSFATWVTFWTFAGRPALIILYVAFVASLIRSKAPRYWRYIHALMYVVLFFGIVHGNLLGEDFENFGIMLIFNTLFAVSIAGFVYKRYRNYYVKRSHNQSSENR